MDSRPRAWEVPQAQIGAQGDADCDQDLGAGAGEPGLDSAEMGRVDPRGPAESGNGYVRIESHAPDVLAGLGVDAPQVTAGLASDLSWRGVHHCHESRQPLSAGHRSCSPGHGTRPTTRRSGICLALNETCVAGHACRVSVGRVRSRPPSRDSQAGKGARPERSGGRRYRRARIHDCRSRRKGHRDCRSRRKGHRVGRWPSGPRQSAAARGSPRPLRAEPQCAANPLR